MRPRLASLLPWGNMPCLPLALSFFLFLPSFLPSPAHLTHSLTHSQPNFAAITRRSVGTRHSAVGRADGRTRRSDARTHGQTNLRRHPPPLSLSPAPLVVVVVWLRPSSSSLRSVSPTVTLPPPRRRTATAVAAHRSAKKANATTLGVGSADVVGPLLVTAEKEQICPRGC